MADYLPNSDHPMLSVIIPTYNAASTLRRCLDCLLDQTTSLPYEIVVSDDGSADHTAQMMEHYTTPRINYLWHENVGRAQNRNIGAENAQGQSLIFIDADVLPTPGFIDAHMQTLDQLGANGVVSGPLPVADECKAYPMGRFLAGKWERRLADLQREPDNVFHMQSGNFAVGKAFFDSLGGFDAQFNQYGGEDTDFFARASLAGAQFSYAPDAVVYQLVELDFPVFLEKSGIAALASNQVIKRYPELASQATVEQDEAQNLKGRVWKWLFQLPGFSWFLLRVLPLIERGGSDKIIFMMYNSLLRKRRQRKEL